ncbi:MAG: FAD-dependent monooxygenase, partial [Alphaproteobacteria bacterium]
MDPRAKILIAGAGPAGLAAALIFSLRGFSPRVIERQRRDEISAPRRGLILRPRTLEMLEETGVTEALIDAGVQITRLRIEEGERALAQFDLSKLKHRYAFLLSLSEEDVMKVLSARLTEFSLSIEYGLAVRNVRLENGKALVSLSDGRTEEYDCLIGADGVQSTVRTALG